MAAKIRVVYFLPCFGIGGTERVVLDLCRKVSQARFDIAVCTMVGGVFAEQVAASGIPVHLLAPPVTGGRSLPGKISNYLKMLSSLRSVISQGTRTVLHTHHYGPLMQAFLLRKLASPRFGWLHTEHSLTDVHNAYALPLYRLLNPMKGADLINGVSEQVSASMRQVSGMNSGRVVTVLNGIETARFASQDGSAKRAELGFAPDQILVGTVGMLRPEKNQQLAVRAFALAAGQIAKLQLVVCGEGECRPALERLAAELGVKDRVHFLGYRTDAHQIMAALDIYCLPSVYEGLPLSVLEAWAAKKPVVATRVMGNADIIDHELNGLLVPLGDAEQMAQAMTRLLFAPTLARQLADQGHDVAMGGFDVKHMVQHYEQIYEKIAC